MSLDPAPGSRQRVLTFVTPKVGDLLFYETKSDVNRAATPAYGTAHPNSTMFPNHKFVFARAAKEDGSVYHWFYAAERANQDDYNWEFGSTSIAGFSVESVTRTYVTLRSAFQPDSPAKGSDMPDVPSGKFAGEWVLFDVEQKRIGDKELDSLFVVEQHTYISRYTNKIYEYDSFFSAPLYERQWIVHRTENVFDEDIDAETLFADPTNEVWGLQEDGKFRGGRRLSSEWYLAIEKDAVSWDFALNGRTYFTTRDYYWPPVLSHIEVDVWSRRDGGAQTYFRPQFAKEGYRGDCSATVTETFHRTEPEISDPTGMQPRSLSASNPFWSFSVSPCLHAGGSILFTPGTEDPVYEYAGANYVFPATTPINWPQSVTIESVSPFRGGFLKSVVTIFPPSDPGEDPGSLFPPSDPGEDPGSDPGEDPGSDPGEDPGSLFP
jgi:hypothetical protein